MMMTMMINDNNNNNIIILIIAVTRTTTTRRIEAVGERKAQTSANASEPAFSTIYRCLLLYTTVVKIPFKIPVSAL